MIKDLNYDEYEKIIEGDKPIFIDFFANWCGPCMMLSPLVEKLAEKYSDKIDFYRVDVDDEEDLAYEFKISSIPLIVIIKDKKIVDKSLGYISENQLEEFVKQVL